jgi:hypothetical protein
MSLSQLLSSDVTGARTAASVAAVVAVLLYFIFAVVGARTAGNRKVRHTDVHGSARPASQDEAKKAALGDMGGSSFHDQTFED